MTLRSKSTSCGAGGVREGDTDKAADEGDNSAEGGGEEEGEGSPEKVGEPGGEATELVAREAAGLYCIGMNREGTTNNESNRIRLADQSFASVAAHFSTLQER